MGLYTWTKNQLKNFGSPPGYMTQPPKQEIAMEVEELYSMLCFELNDDGVLTKVILPTNTNDIARFVKLINLLNNGGLYKIIVDSVTTCGNKTNQVNLATLINQQIKNPNLIEGEEEEPLISPLNVSKNAFAQNNIGGDFS